MEKESITENVRRGLSSAQAEESRRAHGENVLTPPKRTPLWKLYLEKYNDPIIKVLLVAAAVSLALAIIENEFVEVIGIFLAIFLATTIGFYFERDAAKKFDVLTAIGEESPVKVLRDGKVQEVGVARLWWATWCCSAWATRCRPTAPCSRPPTFRLTSRR